MASNKQPSAVARATEHFDFGTQGDPKTRETSRNVRNEITNKPMDPQAVMDAFETAKGIIKPKREDYSSYERRNIILDPEEQEDKEKLDELLNNPNYVIIMWKDTWTQQGSFRVFIVYGKKKEPSK